MVSRRELLLLGPLSMAGFAGCGGLRDERPPTEPDEPVPEPDEEVEPPEEDVVDVTEFGAEGDGSTDDVSAIVEALDAVADGGTVYFPEPDDAYVIAQNGSEPIIEIDGDRHANDLTLRGDGSETVIRVADGTDRSYNMFRIVSPEDFTLTFRDLVLDGNRQRVTEDAMPGECLTFRDNDATDSGDMLVEDVEVRNAKGTGISVQYGGVTCRNVTSQNNGTHGFGVATDRSGVHKPYPLFKRCHSYNNAHGSHGTGIDFSSGTGIAEDVVIEGNRGNAGTKVSVNAIDVRYRRVLILDNEGVVFQNTGSHNGATITFENVIGINNGGPFRLSDNATYRIPEGSRVVMTANRTDDRGQIFLTDSATLEADGDVCSNLSEGGPGLHSNTSASGSYIRNYFHFQNAGGPIRGTDNLEIENTIERMLDQIERIPTSAQVGAWRLPDSVHQQSG